MRSYQDRPIPEEDLDRILEAGWRSPSSKNQQRWDLVVVTERARLEALSRVWRGAGHVATSAAAVALCAPVEAEGRVRESIHYDLGQVTMSMMLAAVDLGIGSGHSAVHDDALAREILGFPDDRTCAWLIAFGYPTDRPLTPIARPDRRAFDDVIHRTTW